MRVQGRLKEVEGMKKFFFFFFFLNCIICIFSLFLLVFQRFYWFSCGFLVENRLDGYFFMICGLENVFFFPCFFTCFLSYHFFSWLCVRDRIEANDKIWGWRFESCSREVCLTWELSFSKESDGGWANKTNDLSPSPTRSDSVPLSILWMTFQLWGHLADDHLPHDLWLLSMYPNFLLFLQYPLQPYEITWNPTFWATLEGYRFDHEIYPSFFCARWPFVSTSPAVQDA